MQFNYNSGTPLVSCYASSTTMAPITLYPYSMVVPDLTPRIVVAETEKSSVPSEGGIVTFGYELRNSAEWIIASPAEIPANGAPYDILLPIIFDNNASPGDIINAYKVSYDNESSGVVLSAVRTSALQDFATATYGLIGKYFPTSKKRAYSDVFSYLPGGNRSSSQILPNYFDMNAIIKKYSTADEYEAWKREFDNLVAYSTASDYWYSAFLYRRIPVKHEVYGALSIYMPQPDNIELNTAFQYTEWYKAAGWDAAGW